MSSSIFRDIPIDSPVRRLRAESKLVSMVAMSMALVFEPTWPMIGTAALLGAVVFRLAKLPIGILPRPPRILLYGVLGGMIGASLSGGDPAVLGLGLGGLLDYLRLILLGLVLIFWAGLLAWSTGLAELGAGLRRLINPLRRVGLPTDELGTVLALAVRALPLVADEVMVVADATMTRPTPPSKRKGPGVLLHGFTLVVDGAVAVVIGTNRRSRDLARSMVSRGSTTAPRPTPLKVRTSDVLTVVIAVGLAVVSLWI
ncbi:MAG: energy-coupling factor transporter transmembrane component T [Acidimicrobiales bacterium]